jgi:hypothetical protein
MGYFCGRGLFMGYYGHVMGSITDMMMVVWWGMWAVRSNPSPDHSSKKDLRHHLDRCEYFTSLFRLYDAFSYIAVYDTLLCYWLRLQRFPRVTDYRTDRHLRKNNLVSTALSEV